MLKNSEKVIKCQNTGIQILEDIKIVPQKDGEVRKQPNITEIGLSINVPDNPLNQYKIQLNSSLSKIDLVNTSKVNRLLRSHKNSKLTVMDMKSNGEIKKYINVPSITKQNKLSNSKSIQSKSKFQFKVQCSIHNKTKNVSEVKLLRTPEKPSCPLSDITNIAATKQLEINHSQEIDLTKTKQTNALLVVGKLLTIPEIQALSNAKLLSTSSKISKEHDRKLTVNVEKTHSDIDQSFSEPHISMEEAFDNLLDHKPMKKYENKRLSLHKFEFSPLKHNQTNQKTELVLEWLKSQKPTTPSVQQNYTAQVQATCKLKNRNNRKKQNTECDKQKISVGKMQTRSNAKLIDVGSSEIVNDETNIKIYIDTKKKKIENEGKKTTQKVSNKYHENLKEKTNMKNKVINRSSTRKRKLKNKCCSFC